MRVIFPLPFLSPPHPGPKSLAIYVFGGRGVQAENFKRPKNREDGSDLDDFLTKSSASIRSRFRKKFARRARARHRRCRRRRRRRRRRRGVGGMAEPLNFELPVDRSID